MIITVEISMYPLQDNYVDLIKDFIDRLNQYDDLKITTSATATMVIGEYDHVMKSLGELIEWSYETHGKSVFIAKFLPGYDP